MDAFAQQFNEITDPDTLFRKLMPALCQMLDCDRCFLYLRDPVRRQGQITHCYSRSSNFPDLTGSTSIEADDIETVDPLMAIAFRTPEPVFVEDIETAGAEIVNLDYERKAFGHRALIHVPLYWQGKLYGILEPCVFDAPRAWTADNRAVIAWLQEKLAPFAFAYVSTLQFASSNLSS
jgi:GAF domain-containing protein